MQVMTDDFLICAPRLATDSNQTTSYFNRGKVRVDWFTTSQTLDTPTTIAQWPYTDLNSIHDNLLDGNLSLSKSQPIDGAKANQATASKYIPTPLVGLFCDANALQQNGFARLKTSAIERDLVPR
jgi:hypothetical protein